MKPSVKLSTQANFVNMLTTGGKWSVDGLFVEMYLFIQTCKSDGQGLCLILEVIIAKSSQISSHNCLPISSICSVYMKAAFLLHSINFFPIFLFGCSFPLLWPQHMLISYNQRRTKQQLITIKAKCRESAAQQTEIDKPFNFPFTLCNSRLTYEASLQQEPFMERVAQCRLWHS